MFDDEKDTGRKPDLNGDVKELPKPSCPRPKDK